MRLSTEGVSFKEKLFLHPLFQFIFKTLLKSNSLDRKDLLTLIKNAFPDQKDEISPTLDHMIEQKILVVDDKSLSSLWTDYGWEDAFVFHDHTRKLIKLNYSKDGEKRDVEKMEGYVAVERPPSNYKTINSDTKISVPYNSKNCSLGLDPASLSDLWEPDIETTRKYLDWDRLSRWLFVVFGETYATDMKVTGRHVAKTSPSGGSRHPIEVYIHANGVKGLQDGLYHYNVEHNEIRKLENNINSQDVAKIAQFSQTSLPKSKVVVFLSCIFERSMFRYRESRSYRVMNLDLGHILETASLTADIFGLSVFRSYAVNEIDLGTKIGINTINESLMAAMALFSGHKSGTR